MKGVFVVMRKNILPLSACMVILAVSVLGYAQQSATATLRGIVMDPNGAVLPGARVIATQKETAIKRETTTNDEGSYMLSNLPPGSYEVKVEANGFKDKISATPVALQVGQTVTLDTTLELGTLGETIDLVGEIPLVETTKSGVEGVIDQREVQSLPLNGRNFLELALLIPGNSPAPNFDPTKSNTVVISSAGQLGRGGNITVDGADDNDDVVGGQVQNISQEAGQEFQIATNRLPAP